VLDHQAKGSADALAALQDVHELLSAHPGFKVVPVKVPPDLVRRTSWIGLLIKHFRFQGFGAEFDGGLTLLRFRVRREMPRRLVLELQWHSTHVGGGRSVFIHFLDAADEIRFHGDYPLEGEPPDALGFFYSRRQVEVPKEAPAGMYRVRLGVWRPTENKLEALKLCRGCLQATAEWCHHAVILDSVEISGDRTP
jgi:hypothetical protein